MFQVPIHSIRADWELICASSLVGTENKKVNKTGSLLTLRSLYPDGGGYKM